MIIDMYNLGKAFVESGGNLGSTDLTEEQKRLAFLTEPHQVGTPLFVLWLDETGTARLDQQEVQAGQSYRLPFIHTAPNAATLTPVLKCEVKDGMKAKTITRTINQFTRLASMEGAIYRQYFEIIASTVNAKTFRKTGEELPRTVPDALTAAVADVVAQKLSGRAALICVASDSDGLVWPGDDQRFVSWLLTTPLRTSVYGTPTDCEEICPVSGEKTELYANALLGAGLNFINGDYRGSFSNLDTNRAWQRAGVSIATADLLYIYKNHVARDFMEYIAGSKALVIPAANAGADARRRFVKGMKRLVEQGHSEGKEGRLLEYLADDDGSVASVTLLWASFAQKFEEATGMITHVLPSRLAELKRIQNEYNKSTNQFHPKHPDQLQLVRRPLNLTHSLAAELTYRPGGAKVKAQNASPQRHTLLREIFAAVYHRHLMIPDNFWKQIAQTARAYVVMLLEQNESSGVVFQLRHEGANAPKKRTPLTVNGWIRHLTMFLSYLADSRIGVFPREEHVYEPTQEGLKPLLAQAKGLNNSAKQFTFLLGVLYGHLIYVQAEKAKVSVASNALSWLRSGRLRSADLPELYAKISSKLLEYHSLGIAKKFLRLHEIETELAQLGTVIGDDVSSRDLPDDKVLYFLMLGMSMSYTFTFTEKPANTKNGDAQ